MEIAERARNNESVLLHAVSNTGLTPIASYIGCDESTVSRMKNGDFERLCKVLAVCDLKIVPADMQCYKTRTYASYQHFAKEYLNLPDEVREQIEIHGSGGVKLRWD